MATRVLVRPNRYADSVSLMALSGKLQALDGVSNAMVAMGTPMNKELLARVGLLLPAAEHASATDLIIAIEADSEQAAAAAVAAAEREMDDTGPQEAGTTVAAAPRTISAAVRAEPNLGLAFISVPGAFAVREARLALEQGLHVMLYSDNVPVESEVALKRLATTKGRLMMGPDCGTAMIDGIGLGFANRVRRGPIGIVAASGTGAQELSVLVDRLGCGISQLIGTGGRDLSAEVGGLMTLDGLKRLQQDPETEVILLISKPPAPEVADAVLAAAEAGPKPVVTCFLAPTSPIAIDEAAVKAVALATGQSEGDLAARLGYGGILPTAAPDPARTDVRGLFSGGTLCDQALMLLERELGPITCNIHPDPTRRGGEERSEGHTLIDLGDDRFTVGRPHPIIDPTLRIQRLRQEAADPRTAVILLDVVLGDGAHPDPAGALAPAIAEAAQRGVAVVASVTGCDSDPQGYSRQAATLRDAGATVLPTARQAALAVLATLRGRS